MSIITISRGTMSGGRAVAEGLGDALGYPVVGHEILVEAADALGVSEETLRGKLERAPGLWERLTSERRLYVAALQVALAEQAQGGRLVYHGNAGHLLLRGLHGVLKVRLIAPLHKRTAEVMRAHGMSRASAEEYVRQVDEDRARWVTFIYGLDVRDPALFDLVVNLRDLTIDDACAVVGEAARRVEGEGEKGGQALLGDFLLASRVKLALVRAPATRSLDLDVTAAAGVVTVRGQVPHVDLTTRASHRWEREIETVVLSVDGVREVRLDVETVGVYH